MAPSRKTPKPKTLKASTGPLNKRGNAQVRKVPRLSLIESNARISRPLEILTTIAESRRPMRNVYLRRKNEKAHREKGSNTSKAHDRSITWGMLLEKLPKAYFEGIGFQEPRLEAMEPITNAIDDEPCACEKKSKTVTCIFMCAIKEFEFEYCKSHSPLPLRLLRRHLFPLTPTVPGIAIHLDVMRSIHNLRFLCHLSMHSVVTYFEAHFHQKVPASLKARLSEALPFYERMMLNVEKMLRCECQVDDVCPGCMFLQGLKGIAADGNFQLRRFKRAQDPPGVIFEGADEVDSLWTDTTVPHNANSPKSGCGLWNALEKQGGRLTGVDETGVFGITCDHGFPLAFLDMKTRGEKFQYVLSTLAKVVQHPLYDERIRIMYDVGCKIGPAVQNTPCLRAINDAPIAVGIFHITGHTPDCQVKYHPRLTIGYGLKDGEWLERLWSYLNGFVSMTRYMTPLNRRLTLTIALKTFARQKVESIAHTLLRKYKRALQVQSDADSALVGFDLEELAVEWEKYVQKVVIEPRGAGNSASVVVTHAWDKLVAAVGIYDITTEAFRQQGNGHNRTQNLSAQKNTAFNEIKKQLNAYNVAVSNRSIIGHEPLNLTATQLVAANSVFRQRADLLLSNNRVYPFDAYHGKMRALEEIDMLKDEAMSVLRYHRHIIRSLKKAIEGLSVSSTENRGKLMLYKQKLKNARRQQKVHLERLTQIPGVDNSPAIGEPEDAVDGNSDGDDDDSNEKAKEKEEEDDDENGDEDEDDEDEEALAAESDEELEADDKDFERLFQEYTE